MVVNKEKDVTNKSFLKKPLTWVVVLATLAGLSVAAYFVYMALKKRRAEKSSQILAEAEHDARIAAVARETRALTGKPGLVAETQILPSELGGMTSLPLGTLVPPTKTELVIVTPEPESEEEQMIELEEFTKLADCKLQTPSVIGVYNLPFDSCYNKAAKDKACLGFASSHKAGHTSNNCELYGANRVTGGTVQVSRLHDYYEKPLVTC